MEMDRLRGEKWQKQKIECSFWSLTDRQTILGRFDVNLKYFCPSHPPIEQDGPLQVAV